MLTTEEQSNRMIQLFGGNVAFARKCVDEILEATKIEVPIVSTGGVSAFVGSTARTKIRTDYNPYWLKVKSNLNKK